MNQSANDWNRVQHAVVHDLRLAYGHLWENVATYLGLFLVEDLAATWSHSQVLRADAFNNLSGIFSTSLLMTGLYIASKTRDDDLWGAPIAVTEQEHVGPRTQQSRFRFETLYTLTAGLVMVIIAADIIYKASRTLILHPSYHLQPNTAGIAALISSGVLLLLWRANHRWAQRLQNTALTAAAQDTYTDALTSLVTVLTILGVGWLHWTWIDGLASLLLGIYILYTGIQIFRNCSLKLVDYFDPQLEQQYCQTIAQLPQVQRIVFLKAYYDGNLVMVSVTIAVDPQMTAATIYQLTQTINTLMTQKYGIAETALMVMPGTESTTG